ncbi:MAG: hypothetical protein D6788_03185 [Planctomycetota bacterium]|nr:MAG: hypothetical protein D6788_03185 [Planctomycetota bacterium]
MRFAVLSLLSGGTLFSTCETRVRDAAVQGTKNFFFSLFNPTTVVQTIFGEDASASVGSGSSGSPFSSFFGP